MKAIQKQYYSKEDPAIGDTLSLEDYLTEKGRLCAGRNAKAVVLSVTNKGNVVVVWVDGFRHGQADGGYAPERFRLLRRYMAKDQPKEIVISDKAEEP